MQTAYLNAVQDTLEHLEGTSDAVFEQLRRFKRHSNAVQEPLKQPEVGFDAVPKRLG
jgi:hypothetical protein